MTLRKVHAGEPLRVPASTWNAFIDTARAYREGLFSVAGPSRLRGRAATVWVKNASGQQRNRFDVLAVQGVVPTPSEDQDSFADGPVLSGDVPTGQDEGRFVILLEPAADGEVAPAVAAGLAVVKVNITDTRHGYADVKPGDAGQLASRAVGAARILWAESGTGTKWALVRLGRPAGTCGSPADMLPAAADFETEAAQTDTWERESPPANTDGLTIRIQTRTAYNEAGDQKLYAYFRQLKFDSTGLLVSVSAETRVVVDVPEACQS